MYILSGMIISRGKILPTDYVCLLRVLLILICVVDVSSIISFTHTVLTFGDAQGDDEENSLTHLDHGFHSKLPPGILPHGLPTVKEVAPAITPQEQKKEEDKKEGTCSNGVFHIVNVIIISFFNISVKELSEEQKQMIILSEDFQRFILKTGKIMERALSETVNIYTDYIGGGDADEGL